MQATWSRVFAQSYLSAGYMVKGVCSVVSRLSAGYMVKGVCSVISRGVRDDKMVVNPVIMT